MDNDKLRRTALNALDDLVIEMSSEEADASPYVSIAGKYLGHLVLELRQLEGPRSHDLMLLEKENTIAGLENVIEGMQRNADTPCTFGDCSVDDVPSTINKLKGELDRLKARNEQQSASILDEMEGHAALRGEYGARDSETFPNFVKRLHDERGRLKIERDAAQRQYEEARKTVTTVCKECREVNAEQFEPNQVIDNLKELNAQLSEQLEQQRDSDGRAAYKAKLETANKELRLEVDSLRQRLDGERTLKHAQETISAKLRSDLDCYPCPMCGPQPVICAKCNDTMAGPDPVAIAHPDGIDGRDAEALDKSISTPLSGVSRHDVKAGRSCDGLPRSETCDNEDCTRHERTPAKCGGHDKDYKLCEVAGCLIDHAGESKDSSPEKQEGGGRRTWCCADSSHVSHMHMEGRCLVCDNPVEEQIND